MTKRTMMVVAAVVVLLVAAPCAAQGKSVAESGKACHPEGTWFGSNDFGNTYVVRVVSVGGGRYSAVADGWSTDDPPIALKWTSFHGELVRTGPRSFWLRQISIVELNPALLPEDFPPLVLAGAEGGVTMTSCDHFNVDFENVGFYEWDIDLNFDRPVPFVDPFFFPLPRIAASYDRMPEY